MGRGIKIRSPLIPDAKVHVPMAKYRAAKVKPSYKFPAKGQYTYRYGSPSIFQKNPFPASPLPNSSPTFLQHAKVFGQPPSSTSQKPTFTPYLGGPMMMGITFMGILSFFGRKQKLKALPPPKEDNSQTLMVVSKRYPSDSSVEKGLFLDMEPRERNRLFFKDLTRTLILPISIFSATGAAFLMEGINALRRISPSLRSNVLDNPGEPTKEVFSLITPRFQFLAQKRSQKNLKKIKKLRKGKAQKPRPELLGAFEKISQETGWSLKLIVAQGMKDATYQEVEGWMDQMFGDDLVARLHWIRAGRVQGGAKFILDLLKVGNLTRPEVLWLLDTLGQIKAGEALTTLENLKLKSPKNWKFWIFQDEFEFAQTQIRIKIGEAREEDADFLLEYWKDDSDIRALDLLRRIYKDREPSPQALEILEQSYHELKEINDIHDPAFVRLVETLVEFGKGDLVEPTLKKWEEVINAIQNEYFENKVEHFNPRYAEQARILAKAGLNPKHFIFYLVRASWETDRHPLHALEAAKSLFELKEYEYGTLADSLLNRAEVDLEAAEFLNRKQPSWSEVILQVVRNEQGPYR